MKTTSSWARKLLVISCLSAAPIMVSLCPATSVATTITVVPESPLKSLDPIITPAYFIRNFGYMIYDTLLALDADGKIQPQMLDHWKVSDDGRTYTMTLRKGLLWTDDTPVTSDDCIASIKRWAILDKTGQIMDSLMESMTKLDGQSWQMRFKVPTDIALRGLSKPSGVPAFMMPERVAKTPADKQITETIGSGPFKFVKEEFCPGIQAVFAKNKKYVPRPEKPSGLAGGKVVYVDEVKWIGMPDSMTAINALVNKEVDLIERTDYDFLPMLEQNKDIKVITAHQLDQQPIARFNFLQPPFDNNKVRQAAMMAVNQKDVLQAMVGNPKYYETCYTVYGCGNQYASTAGSGEFGRGNIAKAKEILASSGYDGTPIVLLHPTDVGAFSKSAPVIAQELRQAGFKVDMQSMDWQSVNNRRTSKASPADGGWNMFTTGIGVVDARSPLSAFTIPANGSKSWFGWPDIPEIEQLRNKFARSSDPAEQKALADEIQEKVLSNGVILPLGQISLPLAVSAKLQGVLETYALVFWNIKKSD
ncbi:ABC transporter substrate-binding protein [uncultured Castellaniella sp.]|uniref:ABC transporter substrate-binding protein n=1 Tax=uncultured Castellaniella sp. TaxID=647907 RepID=UPI002639A66D|nr:ABC transporter substrate-binding protein [uncultured Castellaniella sp.]